MCRNVFTGSYTLRIQQLLWKNPDWRSPVSVLDPDAALKIAQDILDSLPGLLKSHTASDFLPHPAIHGHSDAHIDTGVDSEEDDDDDDEDEEDTNYKNVITIGETHLSGWDEGDLEFRLNPLAELLSSHDLAQLGWTREESIPDEMIVYIVHIGFGNESFESVSRTTILVPPKYQVCDCFGLNISHHSILLIYRHIYLPICFRTRQCSPN